jgi:hypothetical protein
MLLSRAFPICFCKFGHRANLHSQRLATPANLYSQYDAQHNIYKKLPQNFFPLAWLIAANGTIASLACMSRFRERLQKRQKPLRHCGVGLAAARTTARSMEHWMLGAARLSTILAVFGYFAAVGAAAAQSAGPVETVMPNGAVAQQLALTAAQKNAIYLAVTQQGVRNTTAGFAETIGTAVPPATELDALPDQAAADNIGGQVLKYAMVESDVVLVDPVSMRVVDIIRGAAKP